MVNLMVNTFREREGGIKSNGEKSVVTVKRRRKKEWKREQLTSGRVVKGSGVM